MKTLTIKLTAPLQAYGNEASFERRTSWPAPSKSAVVGMIAAALGMRREDERIKSLNDLAYAVRVDQICKTMTEFQTVEWKPGTRKLTYRDHYQDAVYVAAVGSEDEELIGKIEYALKHPRFQLYLGRRACPPAAFCGLKVLRIWIQLKCWKICLGRQKSGIKINTSGRQSLRLKLLLTRIYCQMLLLHKP